MPDTNSDDPALVIVYRIVLTLCVSVALLATFVCGLLFFVAQDEKPTAGMTFTQLTDWEMPQNVTIEDFSYTYSDWPGDGDSYVVVTVDPDTLKTLMGRAEIAWSKWPAEDSMLTRNLNLPEFDATHYRAEHVLPNDDWHRGKIVMVNSTTGKVCAYSWKN